MIMVHTPLPLLPFKDEIVSRGFGWLEVTRSEQRHQLPLQGVALRARVIDRFAVGTMTETFRNTFAEALEATYVFPLPGGAVVHDFEMHVAGRVVRGVVEARAEARRQYQQAMQEGRRAALLEKDREDVFTVQVGNIPPNEEVRIVISWSERLPYFDNGTTELRLPLVVAPRYIPGAPVERDSVGTGTEADTDVVPDASRITPPRLAEGFDPMTGLSIEVELGGGGLSDLECSQHAVRMQLDGGGVTVSLARTGERLNRDFILRWRVAADTLQTRLWVTGAGEQAYGALSIVPPKRDGFLGMPRDVVFVLDRSGSMEGVKMVSASRACAILLSTLGPRDRYAVQLFDDQVEWLDPSTGTVRPVCARPFITADEAGLEKGETYLRTVRARGGTEIGMALGRAMKALDGRADGAGRSPIIVLLTDGQIGDEGRVLKRIQSDLGDSRVFTVGIDTAVNEGFLQRLATLAGGTCTCVAPGEHLEEALRAVGREIGAPLVTDVRVVGDGIEDGAMTPAHIPDLFAGRASVAYLRLGAVGDVRVRGRHADGELFEMTVSPERVDMPAIPQLWARGRVIELEDQFRLEPHRQDALRSQIVSISKAHRVLTRFTAFVLVDDEVVNADGTVRAVTQPVEMPSEWEMDGFASAAPPMAPCAAPPMAPCAAPPMAPSPAVMRTMAAPPAKRRARRTKDAEDAGSLDFFPEEADAADVGTEPSEGLPGGVWSSVSSSARGHEEVIASGPSRRRVDPSVAALWVALERLLVALDEAQAALVAGQRPSATALDRARTAVVKALAGLNRADRLVLLQRFVRTAALELVAALAATDVEVTSLVPLFEAHGQALKTAQREVKAVMGSAPDDFWEAGF